MIGCRPDPEPALPGFIARHVDESLYQAMDSGTHGVRDMKRGCRLGAREDGLLVPMIEGLLGSLQGPDGDPQRTFTILREAPVHARKYGTHAALKMTPGGLRRSWRMYQTSKLG